MNKISKNSTDDVTQKINEWVNGETKDINEELKDVMVDYEKWIEKIHIFSNKLILVIFIVSGIVSIFCLGWIKLVFGIIAVLMIMEICKREGHREGYLDGYINSVRGE
jgi:hypothetical protein